MAFTINSNLVLIDNMQFIYSDLNKLVTSFSDNDFKYLSQEFNGDLLELVKQEGVFEYVNSFKNFSKDKLADKCKCLCSLKHKYIGEKKLFRCY